MSGKTCRLGAPCRKAYLRTMDSHPHNRAQPRVFDAVLTPHRSLSPRAFLLLMAGLALIGLWMGIGLISIGAWPAAGFILVEFLLIYLAFRINYRRARSFETLVLTPDNLELRRVDHHGRGECWNFQPYWLRVQLLPADAPDPELALTSHGRSMVIGRFLAPEERISLAAALNEALARARRHRSLP